MLQPDFLERLAYRQAGHAVMSGLIRQGYIWKDGVDRSGTLYAWKKVTIVGEVPSQAWERIRSGSLASLPNTAYVLLAGYVAQRIKYGEQNNDLFLDNPLVKTAKWYLYRYLDEYAGDTQADYVRIPESKRENDATEWLSKAFEDVNHYLQNYWLSVETLVNALLHHKTLSDTQVFEILEKTLPN